MLSDELLRLFAQPSHVLDGERQTDGAHLLRHVLVLGDLFLGLLSGQLTRPVARLGLVGLSTTVISHRNARLPR